MPSLAFLYLRSNRGGVQSQLRKLRAAQPAGAAAVALQADGGTHNLSHLHRQPHQASVPVRPRLLHRLQLRAQNLPHLPTDHPRKDPAVCLRTAAAFSPGGGAAVLRTEQTSLPICAS